jgi:hypothetical protein
MISFWLPASISVLGPKRSGSGAGEEVPSSVALVFQLTAGGHRVGRLPGRGHDRNTTTFATGCCIGGVGRSLCNGAGRLRAEVQVAGEVGSGD